MVDPYGGGGVAVFYRYLARCLSEAGHSADLYFCQSEDLLERSAYAYCEDVFTAPRHLVEVLYARRYDIVHATTDCVYAPFMVQRAIRRAGGGSRLVVTAHHRPTTASFPVEEVDAVVAVSHETAEAVEQSWAQKALVIPNGIDIRRFREASDGLTCLLKRPILGWVGRADDLSNKDVNGFLYLASALIQEDYDFWVADSTAVSTWPLRSAVDWFGERLTCFHGLDLDSMPAFYRSVERSGGAVLMTSRHEAAPLVLLEAWAAGCPTIVPDAPGFQEAIEGRASAAYSLTDGLPGLIACVGRLRDDRYRAQLVDTAGQLVDKDHRLELMGSGYIDLYRELLGGSRSKNHAMWHKLVNPWPLAYAMRRQFGH
jgi:glycosyltransferase involved in cell wall biosynthesis